MIKLPKNYKVIYRFRNSWEIWYTPRREKFFLGQTAIGINDFDGNRLYTRHLIYLSLVSLS